MNNEERAKLVHKVNEIINDNEYHIQKMDTEKASVPIVDMFADLLTTHAEPAADAVDDEIREILATLLRAGPEFIDDAAANIRFVAERAAATEPPEKIRKSNHERT